MSESKPHLRDVEARAEAATEGPWHRHDFGHAGEQEPSSIVIHTGEFDHASLLLGEGGAVAWMPTWDRDEDLDATFIAASRTDVPALTAAIRAVLDLLDGYEGRGRITVDMQNVRDTISAHIDLED
jgi:hypothetical protein